MKRIIGLFLLFALAISMPFAVRATQQTTWKEPHEIICVDGKPVIEDNQRFSRKEKVIVVFVDISYRWHITNQTDTEVTYLLEKDVDPRGGHEKWVGMNDTRTLTIPDCTPEEPPVDEPTDTPEESTPSAEISTEHVSDGMSDGLGWTDYSCKAERPEKPVANFHLYRNGDVAKLYWLPDGRNAPTVNIYYRLNTSDSWEHAVREYPNNGYIEITGLGDRDWTFAIAQNNNCIQGDMSQEIVDDTATGWVLFR